MLSGFLLMFCSALVIGALGAVHLFFTFHGDKLEARDPALREAMRRDSPVISRATTLWRATKGFNASHSLGALLFALVFGYLALWHPVVLLQSIFLQALGMTTLFAYLGLAWFYWFHVPFRGIALACVLYAAGLALLPGVGT